MSKFSVIATSGWQGDGWELIGLADTRREAEQMAQAAKTADPKSTGYITAVIGSVNFCTDHMWGCVVGDTSRVRVSERHLKSRKCHIADKSNER